MYSHVDFHHFLANSAVFVDLYWFYIINKLDNTHAANMEGV